ncbi:MAG: hypothetical protein AAGK37_06400 [Pseudomonadota bacterium]
MRTAIVAAPLGGWNSERFREGDLIGQRALRVVPFDPRAEAQKRWGPQQRAYGLADLDF